MKLGIARHRCASNHYLEVGLYSPTKENQNRQHLSYSSLNWPLEVYGMGGPFWSVLTIRQTCSSVCIIGICLCLLWFTFLSLWQKNICGNVNCSGEEAKKKSLLNRVLNKIKSLSLQVIQVQENNHKIIYDFFFEGGPF